MKLYHINSTLNPFEEARKIQRQLDQVFSEISNELTQEFSAEHYTTDGSVPIELEETATEFYLRVLLPALDQEKLDIHITRNRVTIAGQYQRYQADISNELQQPKTNAKHRFYSEFPTGKFRRTLSLAVPVLNTEAVAEYRDGVLMLTIPKAPEAIDQVVKLSLNTSPTTAATAATTATNGKTVKPAIVTATTEPTEPTKPTEPTVETAVKTSEAIASERC